MMMVPMLQIVKSKRLVELCRRTLVLSLAASFRVVCFLSGVVLQEMIVRTGSAISSPDNFRSPKTRSARDCDSIKSLKPVGSKEVPTQTLRLIFILILQRN